MQFGNPATSATGPVTVTGTVDIGNGIDVNGALTAGTPPVGSPSFAQRLASATSAAATNISAGTTSASLVPASPGVILELHSLVVSGTFQASGVANCTVELRRNDTNAIIWQASVGAVSASVVNLGAINYDFQGVQLPTGVGVLLTRSTANVSSTNATTITASLSYTPMT